MAKPSRFYFSEVSICSSIELPELPRAFSPAELEFRFKKRAVLPLTEADWIHDWLTPEGDTAFSCFKTESGYHLRFPNRTEFAIAPDGSWIRGYAHGEDDLEAVRHDLLTQVLPRVLSHRGRIVLHASSVGTPDGAIAFLGGTGTGKSTIAASFSRFGFPVISDDCLAVDLTDGQTRAVPTLRGPRLWPDSAEELLDREVLPDLPSEPSGKISLPDFTGSENHPLGALRLIGAFVLQPASEPRGLELPTFEKLSPAEALMSLVEHSFQLDITHRPSQELRLELFSQVVQDLPTYRLDYEQEYSCLDTVQQRVLNQLAERA